MWWSDISCNMRIGLTCSLNYFVSIYSICWLLYNSIRQLILQWYIALYKPLHSMFHNSDTTHCTNHCNDISGCTAIASTNLKLCYMLCCSNQCIHYSITGINVKYKYSLQYDISSSASPLQWYIRLYKPLHPLLHYSDISCFTNLYYS